MALVVEGFQGSVDGAMAEVVEGLTAREALEAQRQHVLGGEQDAAQHGLFGFEAVRGQPIPEHTGPIGYQFS